MDGHEGTDEATAQVGTQAAAATFSGFRAAMKAVKEEARELAVYTGAPPAECIAVAAAMYRACVCDEYTE